MGCLINRAVKVVIKMDYEELRPLILESLKNSGETQIIPLLNDVERIALQKGHYQNAQTWSYGGQATVNRMPREDREKVREIANDLIVEGILGWGISESQPGPPFLKVTRYGKECIDKEGPQPYDPDGYLKYLKSEIPNIDDIIFMYITESVNAYLRGLMLSSTVMLGGASEKAFLLLFETFTNALSDAKKKQEFVDKLNAPIKKKIDLLRQEFESLKNNRQIPRHLADDLDIQLDGICNFIRTCRNDVGHPSGRIIERGLAYANLRLFIPYCKRIYDLMDHFNNNPV